MPMLWDQPSSGDKYISTIYLPIYLHIYINWHTYGSTLKWWQVSIIILPALKCTLYILHAIHLHTYISISLDIFFSTKISVVHHMLWVFLFESLNIYHSDFLAIKSSISLTISNLKTILTIDLCIYLSLYLSVFVSICLCIYLYIYLCI